MSTPPAFPENGAVGPDEQPEADSSGDASSGEAVDAADDVIQTVESDDPIESSGDGPSPEGDDKSIAAEEDVPGDDETDGGRRRGRRHRLKFSPPPPSLPIHADVRYTDYEGFKNFYDDNEASYAIHVLQAGYNLKEDVNKERVRRGVKPYSTPRKGTTRSGNMTDEVWIQRVRIQSKYILAHFRAVSGNSAMIWDNHRVFFRPFHSLIHFQAKMKEAYEETREKLANLLAEQEQLAQSGDKDAAKDDQTLPVGDSAAALRGLTPSSTRRKSAKARSPSPGSDSGSASDSDSGSDSGSSTRSVTTKNPPEDILISQEAVDHLKCYIDFVDEKIMPLWDMYKGTSKKYVRYSDLAYLFHPGDVLYSPQPSEKTNTNSFSSDKLPASVYQPVWKVQYTNPPSISEERPEDYDGGHKFYISCFYIDFDGKAYGPVKYRFNVESYTGEVDIRHLPVYPIRYRTAPAKSSGVQGQDELQSVGKNFQFYVKEKHLYYRGWTLTTSPNGETLTDNTGENMKHPEHVDSGVIVDFKAALQALPSWRPVFREPSTLDEEWTSTDDPLLDIQWSDTKRTKEVRRWNALLQLRDPAHAFETHEYANTDPFLTAYVEDLTDERYELTEDNLQLLPGRVMGYVLRDRKFVQLDVRHLRKIEQQENVFGSLKIADDHKEMVMALVDSHFRKKAIKDPLQYSLGQDLIQGKGEGLVVLLHGVPGVGKTATAEAVAQFKKQPLFVITCGDLGFTPREVEKSLEEIFRLAHMWDCILLLDEADVFLAERTRDDLKRNALVSVFLRVLEYYSGILFLTTNRVGTLDEAFKSRIHMSLYYPPLNLKQTIQIFEMNIDRIEKIDQQRQQARVHAPVKEDKGKGVAKEKEKEEEKDTKENKGRKENKENKEAKEDKLEAAKGRKHEDKSELSHHLVVERESVLRFAKKHFKRSKQQARWNGRQIRNAFQIASSLAFYDKHQAWMERKEKDDTAVIETAVLSDKQFRKVALATRLFEDYMLEARGIDDHEQARMDRTRADSHVAKDQDGYGSDTPRGDWNDTGDRYDRDLQVDNYRNGGGGGSNRKFGGPPSPAPPRTPQSTSRRGDDYDRYDGGSRYSGRDRFTDGGSRGSGQDRQRRGDGDRYRDRERERDRHDDYEDRGDYSGRKKDGQRDGYRDDRDRGTPARGRGGGDLGRDLGRDPVRESGRGDRRERGTRDGTPTRPRSGYEPSEGGRGRDREGTDARDGSDDSDDSGDWL